MDIKQIDEFFGYKPFFSTDTQILVDDIVQKASKYLPTEQLTLIQETYEFARSAHTDILRLSDEPYIVHPLRATQFLMEIKPDIASIQWCILHDVIEDTAITYEEVHKKFGEEVANICEWLVKVSKIKYKGEDRQIETLKKTFLAMAKDLRVIFIKLADRIHNIQTLHYHPKKEKQEKIANETLKIFVPIAKRLWLYQYQLYLENGCFSILHPEEFHNIVQYLKKIYPTKQQYVEKWTKKLQDILQKEWIHWSTIKWRLKSPYRIRQKMSKWAANDYSQVLDTLAYRIITRDVAESYLCLWLIHKYYTPMIKNIKDYIAIPKFNGYQSLHTTILGMFDFPVEIQIRTYEMDEIAEFGVAAHYGYSDTGVSIAIPKNQAEWIKKLQDMVNTYQTLDDKEWFKNELNIEMLNKTTFLYTPKGDIVELSQWASVLDFAFHVHTNVGLTFKNALVNREIKPINYIPKTGDVVMIQTWKNKYTANKSRLEYLHTPSAKANLNRYIKNKEKDETLKHIIAELNKKLKELNLPMFRTQEDKIHKLYDNAEIEKKLMEVADKKSNINRIIKSAYPEEHGQIVVKAKKTIQILDSAIIDGNQLLNYELCPECKPTIEDKIIAKSGRHGIKIHAMRCKALKTVNYAHLLETHRLWQEPNHYVLSLTIDIPNKNNNMLQIMQKINDLRMHVMHVGMRNISAELSELDIEVQYTNPTQIDFLLTDIKKYLSIVTIKKRQLS